MYKFANHLRVIVRVFCRSLNWTWVSGLWILTNQTVRDQHAEQRPFFLSVFCKRWTVPFQLEAMADIDRRISLIVSKTQLSLTRIVIFVISPAQVVDRKEVFLDQKLGEYNGGGLESKNHSKRLFTFALRLDYPLPFHEKCIFFKSVKFPVKHVLWTL